MMPHHPHHLFPALMPSNHTRRLGAVLSALLAVCVAHAQATREYTHERRMDGMFFSPDGGSLMTIGSSGSSGNGWEDGKVYLWATQGPSPRSQEFPLTKTYVFSGDGQKFFMYGNQGILVDVGTGQQTDLHLGNYAWADALGPDATSVIYYTDDMLELRYLSRPDSGWRVTPLPTGWNYFLQNMVNTKGGAIAVAIAEHRMDQPNSLNVLWLDPATGSTRVLYKGDGDRRGIRVSPDGRYLFAGLTGHLIDGATGAILQADVGKKLGFDATGAVSFTPDGSRFTYITDKGVVGTWTVEPFESVAKFKIPKADHDEGALFAVNCTAGLYAYTTDKGLLAHIGSIADQKELMALVVNGTAERIAQNEVNHAKWEARRDSLSYVEAKKYEEERVNKLLGIGQPPPPPPTWTADAASNVQAGQWLSFSPDRNAVVAEVLAASNGRLYVNAHGLSETEWVDELVSTFHILRADDVHICSACNGGVEKCWYCAGNGWIPEQQLTNTTTEIHNHDTWYYMIETTEVVRAAGQSTCPYCGGSGRQRIKNNQCQVCAGRGWYLR